ncbi:MAG: hypothetical protein U5N86_08890 [Planctomycetota bacterium]|nr:hypothetical protein [Planctomycetota bacterium]
MFSPTQRRFALAGFAFELERNCEKLQLYMRSNSPMRVSFDTAMLRPAEQGFVIADGAEKTGRRMLLDAFAPTHLITVDKLKPGRHAVSFGVMLDRPCNISVYAYCDDQPVTPLPLVASDFVMKDARGPELRITPLAETVMVRNRVGLFGLRVSDAKEFFNSERFDVFALSLFMAYATVTSDVREKVEKLKDETTSPVVAKWLSQLEHPDSHRYDLKCLKAGVSGFGVWERTTLRGRKGQEAAKKLLERVERLGWYPEAAKKYCELVAGGVVPNALDKMLADRPYSPALHTTLTANTSRIDIGRKLRMLRKLYELSPDNTALGQELVRMKLLTGRANGDEISSELCSTAPWIADNWVLLGEVLRVEGKYELCRKAWARALELNADYPHLRQFLQQLPSEKKAGGKELSNKDLAQLRELAGEVELPKGIGVLYKQFDIRLNLDGTLRAAVTTYYYFDCEHDAISVNAALREWSSYRVSRVRKTAQMVEGPGSCSLEKGRLVFTDVAKTSVVKYVAEADRSTIPVFAPEAFDYLPAALHDLPVVSFEYVLHHRNTEPNAWASPSLKVTKGDGLTTFSSSKPLVFTGASSGLLPALAWSTLDIQDFSSIVANELYYNSMRFDTSSVKLSDNDDPLTDAVNCFNYRSKEAFRRGTSCRRPV